MSEHDGVLRVLASSFDFNNEDFVDHKLYLLRESATLPELETIAELPNEARPDEIGKPNEALYGVRFLADRAYAVTFERIDPLYAIDLSDIDDPKIAGELEITGFSDFLHPVNQDLLLGIGTGEDGGVKVELFDVSDLSQPLSRGGVSLGPQSHSEATRDRHAFTYQADVNGIERFTIPATAFNVPANGSADAGAYSTGLHLFEIRDKTMPNLSTLNAVGTILPPPDEETFPYDTRNRAFIHDDTVFYVLNEAVWSAFWSTPDTVNGPF